MNNLRAFVLLCYLAWMCLLVSMINDLQASEPSKIQAIDWYVEFAREISGCDLTVTSGYRTIEENKRVHGVTKSYHLLNRARDVVIDEPGCTTYEDLGEILYPMVTVIIYTGHIHIDDREHSLWLKGTYKTK